MKFTVHTIVKNEDQWVWYALQSVLSFASKILVFDTGSKDKTVELIKSIKSPKIVFEEKGEVSSEGLVKLRQEQIDKTNTNWFLILDGDEIWPSKQLKTLLKAGDGASNIVALFNKVRVCVGDVFHYLPDSAGKYEIAGKKGNLNIRLIKKTKDLKVTGIYPLESFENNNGPLQRQDKNLKFVNCWYLHTSFLKRSSKDLQKTSGSLGKKKTWEKGIKMKKQELPNFIPLEKRSSFYEVASTILTPIVSLKREL